MAIAQCECGKRTQVADVLAGRMIRCSACGNDVAVPSAPASTQSSQKSAGRPGAAAPSVAVSPTLVRFGLILGVLAIVWAIFYFVPWRVGSEWAAMSQRANDEATDVVLFAIQAYETEHGLFDPSLSHHAPQLAGPASFVAPMMAFSMPKNVVFLGKTNQGNYSGTYDTTNGEIDATIEIGGFTVGGLVDVRKAPNKIHITGREKNGHPQAELDGKPLGR